MKSLKYAAIVYAILALIACENTVEEVMEVWPNGTNKMVQTYRMDGDVRVKLSNVGYYESGQQEISGGFNEDGGREGEWTYWYPNGTVWSRCNYKEGIREGKITVYYETGQKRYEGQNVADKPSGNWKFWDTEGKLAVEKNY